jgi:aspartate/methionine/tyrosine aminotransferase
LDENIIPIKLDGITKELLMYGGRIGAITIGLHKKWFASDSDLEKCKAELENKFSGFIRSSVSNSNIFYQTVLNALLSEENIETTLQNRKKVEDMLRDRYKLINSELKKIDSDEISIDPNRGGFFLFVNLRTIKATEFADLLLRKYRVGVIPIEKPQLGINGFRIAYCSIDIKKIPELVSRMQEALKEYN